MKRIFLFTTLLVTAGAGYSQTGLPGTGYSLHNGKGVVKGVIITEKKGFYGKPDGQGNAPSFRLITTVDTLHKQLISVTHLEKRGGEWITIYHFQNNELVLAITGRVYNNNTVADNQYEYTEEDNSLKDKEVKRLSEENEKFSLLQNARIYLQNFRKEWIK